MPEQQFFDIGQVIEFYDNVYIAPCLDKVGESLCRITRGNMVESETMVVAEVGILFGAGAYNGHAATGTLKRLGILPQVTSRTR